MKIKLERKEIFCPKNLTCTVCGNIFAVQYIRTLLYSDRGLLQGDICQNCLKAGATKIKTKLKEQVWSLLLESEEIVSEELKAAELLAIAEEKVKFPSFWQWWLKRMAVLAAETQELEKARLGNQCDCDQRQQLERIFTKSEI